MFRKAFLPAALAVLALAACGRAPEPKAEPAAEQASEAQYVAPPRVQEARLERGAFVLVGAAPAGARVRLAEPNGQALFAAADAEGRWTLSVPVGAEAKVFGVSAAAEGRTVQSQGYLLLAPDGKAVLLRAGGGAHRLDRLRAPAICALDFDAVGGAVVSGLAPAGAQLFLRLDGRQAAEARADGSGHFEIALPRPITAGAHTLTVAGDGFAVDAQVEVTPAAELTEGPFRARREGGALRADWVTPGGGVQSTLIPG